jgi:phospholipase A1
MAALLFAAQLGASESIAQDAIPSVEPGSIEDHSGNDPARPTVQAGDAVANSSDECTESPFSSYKVNYFSLSDWPANDKAVIKFQLSIKYQVLDHDVHIPFTEKKMGLYFAYTQKSFWDIGKESGPFEESNYNPEFFISFKPKTLEMSRLKIHEILISPYEHESNGVDGGTSRSWNRNYAAVRLGYAPGTKYDKADAFIDDIVELNFKVWHAWGYSDNDAYLQSTGSTKNFLDYAGHGEIRLKMRNIAPWPGDNQLDLYTRVFHDSNKNGYSAEFQQKIPGTNFSAYIQYWRGYGESLLRFDRFERSLYVGLSFCL